MGGHEFRFPEKEKPSFWDLYGWVITIIILIIISILVVFR